MGVALNAKLITEADSEGVALVERHFDSITPENCMKWEALRPGPGLYDFRLADRYVDFGLKRGLFVIGHTLLWHEQTPAWVYVRADGTPKSREELLGTLVDHIHTVVTRYRGRVRGWDVVNEAVADSGLLRTDKPWYKILGEEGIFAAFAAAHEADPSAELYYNDYSLWIPAKQKAVLELVAKIRARGLRIDGVGMQEHYMMAGPSPEEVGATIDAFEQANIPVMITELDLSVLPRPNNYTGADISKIQEGRADWDPYTAGLPPRIQEALASRYAALFETYRRHARAIRRITFWGLSDAHSWLNDWPIPGRSDHPLLFDRKNQPKPALEAVMHSLDQP